MMNTEQFRKATFVLRRRAMDDEPGLWNLVKDAEAFIEGKPTTLPRDEVVAAVEREMR